MLHARLDRRARASALALALTPTLALTLALALAPRAARACAAAWPASSVRPVEIASEDAVILWDPATRTEHFVRRATFGSAASDFGFLVPTPTRPALAEAGEAAVEGLEALSAPRVEYTTRRGGPELALSCLFLWTRGAAAPVSAARTAPAPPVRVIERRNVAGFDAAVLQADDPNALTGWLRDNGYEARPALAPWLARYTATHWFITAFRIAPGSGEGPARTQALRMTFTTDQPFFPYREPADSHPDAGPARLLRVHFIAPGRVQGRVGEAAAAWRGEATYAAPLTDAERRLRELLPEGQGALPEHPWLTVFEDRAARRPGDAELVFSAAPDVRLEPVERIERVVPGVPIFVDWIALLAVAAWLIARLLFRRRRAPR
jgi:hypothetical protein